MRNQEACAWCGATHYTPEATYHRPGRESDAAERTSAQRPPIAYHLYGSQELTDEREAAAERLAEEVAAAEALAAEAAQDAAIFAAIVEENE